MKNDNKIEKLRKTINERKEDLVKPSTNYKTNCLFKEGTVSTNIHTLVKENQCIEFLQKIIFKKMVSEEAQRILSHEQEIEVSGYPIDDWIDDIKTRYSILQYATKQKELNVLDKKLQELFSEEAQTKNSISDIESQLGI